MKNLKFRAWWNNRMYYVAGILFATQQEGEPEWENCGIPKQIALMRDAENSKLSWHDAEECVLLQSTGLFDKNGKEIHGGYIVKHGDQILFVEWGEPEAGFCLIDTPPNSAYIGMTSYFSDDSEDYEVIGNIYENPEINDEYLKQLK